MRSVMERQSFAGLPKEPVGDRNRYSLRKKEKKQIRGNSPIRAGGGGESVIAAENHFRSEAKRGFISVQKEKMPKKSGGSQSN